MLCSYINLNNHTEILFYFWNCFYSNLNEFAELEIRQPFLFMIVILKQYRGIMNFTEHAQLLRNCKTQGNLKMIKCNTQQVQEQLQSEQLHLRNCSQSNAQKNIVNSKTSSISSLIAKIKNVQRVDTTSVNSAIRQSPSEIPSYDKGNSKKLIKDKQTIHSQNLWFNGYQDHEMNLNIQTYNRTKQENKSKFTEKLQHQNNFLRHNLNKLMISHQKLTEKLKDLYEVIKSKNQLISQLKQQKYKKQNTFCSQKQSLITQLSAINESILQISPSRTKNYVALSLECQTVKETVVPIENHAFKQLSNQIAQLKLGKIQMERSLKTNMNHLLKQKKIEQEAMRQDFRRKLNHYKQLLYKCTSRPSKQQKIISDDTKMTTQTKTRDKE